jgi:hypothetical protein
MGGLGRIDRRENREKKMGDQPNRKETEWIRGRLERDRKFWKEFEMLLWATVTLNS